MDDEKYSNILQVIRNQIAALSFEELRLIKTIKNIRQQRNYLIEFLEDSQSTSTPFEDNDADFEKVIEFPNDQVKN